jgi:Flp pilus assembly pilin Flp
MPLLTRTHPPQDEEAGQAHAMTRRSRCGATLMEYLMMLSLIVVVCLVGIGYVGTSNSGNMNASSTAIGKALKKGS